MKVTQFTKDALAYRREVKAWEKMHRSGNDIPDNIMKAASKVWFNDMGFANDRSDRVRCIGLAILAERHRCAALAERLWPEADDLRDAILDPSTEEDA